MLRALALVLLFTSVASAQPNHPVDRTGRSERSARLRAIGERYAAAGDIGSALSYFREAVSANPDDARAYEALGRTYLDRGSMRDALQAFEVGLRRSPYDSGLVRGLAGALESLGRPEDATEILRALTEHDPRDVTAWKLRAELSQRRSRWVEALACYRAILDRGQRGDAVATATLEEARRYVAALTRLAGRTDPLAMSCDGDSEVQRALAGCDRAPLPPPMP